MFLKTTNRTNQPELMDNPEIESKELLKAFKDINHTNAFLGGNRITLEGILQLEKERNQKEPLHITDIGCGDGTILKICAQYAIKHNKNWLLSGIDNSSKTIAMARKNTAAFPQIKYTEADVFSETFENIKTNIFILTLTLHHFTDAQIMTILEKAIQQANVGVVINDLHRSSFAYRLFQVYSFFFLKSPVAKNDGLVSILRGFKKNELKTFASHFAQVTHSIKHKWAFRWQWIIKKI